MTRWRGPDQTARPLGTTDYPIPSKNVHEFDEIIPEVDMSNSTLWPGFRRAGDPGDPHHAPSPLRRWRLLQAAALLFLLLLVSGGLGLTVKDGDYALERRQMVDTQLGRPRNDITHPGVLQAMATVPRHEFVEQPLRPLAYTDGPLPIGYGQTISQPYVVAFMTEQLDPRPSDRVLEVGTGSGYQAAVLSRLVKEVYSIEIVAPLAERAKTVLSRLGYDNIKLRQGDGYQGWPEAAPFDAVIVTCAPDHVPQPLIDQLRDGGRMIIPVGPAEDQNLYLLRKRGDHLERESVLPVRFVPMTGTAQDSAR